MRNDSEWLALPVLAAFALAIGALVATNPAQAGMPPSPDPDPALPIEDIDAQVVFVRQNCIVDGVEMKNCVDSQGGVDPMDFLSNPTDGWIWFTRNPKPSASSPLLVDIGPGDFGRFTCPASTPQNGWVTLRGSGREQTRIVDEVNQLSIGVNVENCEKLAFDSLTVGGRYYAIQWKNGGSATWSDVEVITDVGVLFTEIMVAWYDVCDPGVEGSTQYWFGSRIYVDGPPRNITIAYNPNCSETWFFGGEITLEVDEDPAHASISGGPAIWGGGDLRLFGTVVRARLAGADSPAVNLTGVRSSGVFHIHGGIINVDASARTGTGVVGLEVLASGFAHTPGTAFTLKPGAGAQAIRLGGSGIAQSPFLWQSGQEPPIAPTSFSSQDGSDMFVETDCLPGGDCLTGGMGAVETHIMIYNSAKCTGSDPWFNATKQCCRDSCPP